MNEFESMEHLNQVFKSGAFTLPEAMTVHGIPFHRSQSIVYPISELVEEEKKGFQIYAVDPKATKTDQWKDIIQQSPNAKRAVNERIILIWAMDDTLSLRPARAVTNTAARMAADLETASHTLREGENVIPDTVKIKFLQFNKEVPGKVDTGANLSSLHCEEWRVLSGKGIVEFRCSLLSDNTIRTELLDQVAIKTSEGSEYRPVVALNIAIAGKTMQNCKFNLNDRSKMEAKILIGQNVLEKGGFLVDPNIQKDRMESVDWDALQELYKDVVIIKESAEDNKKQIDELYQAMLDSDVTMSDLAHHILIQE